MIGLILEGGGMRGAFTAGVLDAWLDAGLHFRDIYGVSAGACQACSYACRQRGRGLRIWLNYMRDPRFCSVRSLLTTGDLFGAEFSYSTIPLELDPVDNDAFHRYGANVIAVVTDVKTGRPAYFPIEDMHSDLELVRASASMPLVSNIVEWKGGRYLDGGVADSIPIRKSIADGHGKNVLVLTQARDYRKRPNRAMPLMKLKYRKYPGLVDTAGRRHAEYNDTLDFIRRESDAHRAFVLQPDVAPEVGRVEKDPDRLKRLYDVGVAIARREHARLLDFIGDEPV